MARCEVKRCREEPEMFYYGRAVCGGAMVGRKFGRLTVLAFSHRSVHGHYVWRCRCSCGEKKDILGYSLRSGDTESCGCLAREQTAQRSRTHGRRGTPEYRSWACMKTRCTNKRIRDWDLYGGRGIRVCRRWLNSFENFLADVGPKPGPDFSLERLDNDKDYRPGNVVWGTKQAQSRNRRGNVIWSFRGEKRCIAAWANKLLIHENTLRSRVFQQGWTIAEALVTRPGWGRA